VVNGNCNSATAEDVICSCSPTSATVSASQASNITTTPSSASKQINNNHHHSHSQSSSSKAHDRGQLSPYLVSAATSPRKKHTKTVISASGLHETTKTLPPLDINKTILYHHSTRRSARKSSRGHTVPVMQLGAASKRSHSAASTQDEAGNAIIMPGTPEHHIPSGRRSRQSPERKSSKVLYTPEKISRRGHILNKIETVRILRARPAFYPIKHSTSTVDKVTISTNSNKSSARSVRDYAALVDVGAATAAASSGSHTTGVTPGAAFPMGHLTHQDMYELPHNILGKHITLRMDRSEMKRKHRARGLASLPPHSNLT